MPRQAGQGAFLVIIIIVILFITGIGFVGLYTFFKYLFHCEPIIVENTNNEEDIPSIIIVGRTGSGKSTLANVLLGEVKFAEVSGSSSGTKNIQSENFRWNGKRYRVIDTIGTGDTTELSDNEIYSTVKQVIKNLGGNNIKRIFFVYKDRFTEEQVKAFQAFNRFFQTSLYITIVCSNFVEFRDRGKCKADIQKLLKENKSIARVIKGCKIIHVDNPPLQYRDAREIRQCSREKLLNYLDEIISEKPNTEDIDVDEIIKELEN